MGKSAYNYFVAETRNKVKEEHPEWKFGEVSKEVGRLWKELSAEEKKKYEDMVLAKPVGKKKEQKEEQKETEEKEEKEE